MCNNSFEIKSGSDNAIFLCFGNCIVDSYVIFFFCELYFLI